MLGFEIRIQALGAEFSAPAGFLHSAEGGVGGGGDAVVEGDHAGFEVFGEAEGAGEVVGVEVGGEAEGGGVGFGEDFSFGVEEGDGGDGAEDFFGEDAGVVGDVGEDGGFQEEAVVVGAGRGEFVSAEVEFGAFTGGVFDEVEEAGAGGVGDDGADFVLGIEA